MAIDTSILISSAAKNGTLGSQAAAATDEIIFDTDITTNNGNLELGPSFIGRTVIVRQGVTSGAATGTLTFTGVAVDSNTVLINGKTYTFKTAFTEGSGEQTANGEVLHGATAQNSLDNLIAAINLDLAGYGTQYSQPTTPNSDVTVVDGGSTTMTATASTAGTAGNSITTTVGGGMTTASWGGSILSGGTDGEETKFMTTVASLTITVNEVWDAQPASGDTYHICYITYDVDTIGNNFKLLSKRNTDWAAAQEITVGDGTNFAYFALLEGHSIETVDNGSTTVADIIIKNNGRFDSGYVASGTPVSGGYTVTTPDADGELSFDVQTGGITQFNDYFITAAKANNMTYWNGDVTFNKTKIYKNAYTLQAQGNISATDLTIEGIGTTNDTVLIDASTDIQSMVLISTYGFITDNDATVQTITLNDVTFVGNSKLFVIEEKKTINLIDPVSFSPVVSDQTEIDFITPFDGVLNEKYSLNTTVAQADGTLIGNSRIFLYSGGTTDSIVLDLTTNPVTGSISSSWIYKTYTDNTTTITVTEYGSHALKVYKYGFIPFVATQTSNVKFSDPITLGVDTAQSETTQDDAITLGDTTNTVSLEEQPTNPASIIKFTGGTGTLNVGNTVTGASSGADGVVVEIIEGDSTAGTIVLDTRDALNFSTAETLNESGGSSDWSATYTTSSQLDFTWLINADTLTAQQLYDYMSAKFAEDILDTSPTFDDAVAWGTDEHGFMIQASGAKFKTVRNVVNTEGIAIYGLGGTGLGAIDFFTADDGSTFTPAVTVSVTITVQDGGANAIVGAQVSIFLTADDTVVLASTATDASGQATTTYAASAGAIYVRVRQSTNTATFLTSQSFTSNILTTVLDHSLVTGEAVTYDKDGGTAAIGLTDSTIYYVRNITSTTITIHPTAADALANTNIQTLTTNGSETHNLDPVRYIPNSTVGTIGTSDFSATVTMVTDTTVTD